MIHVYIGEEGPYLLSLVRKEVNNILKEDKNDFNFASFDMLNSFTYVEKSISPILK